ncbi:MAG: DNA polymerase III subunit beta [Candidatus Sifarchaeia archaeon]|jgi:DNA polymerase-3 subunit beta
MEFGIEKKDFVKPLTILQAIAERRSSIPALNNILIESDKDQIYLTTTDLETTIICHLPCSLNQSGKICLSARKLYEIIRELPEAHIDIQRMENHWAKITCKNAIFNLSGLDPVEFPTVPTFSKDALVPIKSFDIREMIEKVIFAASTEESRYNLNGVFFESIPSEEKKLARMVATDGHRLALIEREAPEFLEIEMGVIIPRRGLNEVKRIVGEYPGDLRVSLSENSFVIEVSPFLIIVRLIDGEFPDYKQVIPSGNDKLIRLNTRDFRSCLRRISTISADRVEGVKFSVKKGAIELYSASQNIGNALEEFPAAYDGAEMNVGFNARYVLDALNEIDEDEFFMELKDETSAAIIRPASEKTPLYVVMPMRV